MKSTIAIKTEEPLLIEGKDQNSFSILPKNTVLYYDKGWAEGHQTYHVYFHFKGKFSESPADANVIDPLWLRTVEKDEISKLMSDYPLTREELVSILKARKITRDELAQIVRDWTD